MHANKLTVAAVLGAVMHAERPGNVVEELLSAVPFSHDGNADLWVLDVTDPAIPGFTQLTFTPGLNEKHPTWSSDETQIAYSGYPVNRDWSAFVMNADGGGSHVIAEVGNEWGMDWIPPCSAH